MKKNITMDDTISGIYKRNELAGIMDEEDSFNVMQAKIASSEVAVTNGLFFNGKNINIKIQKLKTYMDILIDYGFYRECIPLKDAIEKLKN